MCPWAISALHVAVAPRARRPCYVSYRVSGFDALEVGVEFLLGPEQLVPGDHAIAIGGGAAEDRDQVASHAALDGRVVELAAGDALVEGLDIGDRAFLVDSGRGAAAIEVLAADDHLPAVLGLEDALASEHAVADALGLRAMALDLAGAEGDADVVGILEQGAEGVPAGSDRPDLAAARAHGPQRRRLHDPVHHVQRVDVLLRDDVAGEDLVEAPGPQAVLAVLRVAAPGVVHPPEGTGRVIRRLAERNLSDGFLVVYAAQGLLIKRIGPRLEVDQKHQLLAGGLLAAVLDAQTAGDIDGGGLGQVRMLARLDQAHDLYHSCPCWIVLLPGFWHIQNSIGVSLFPD